MDIYNTYNKRPEKVKAYVDIGSSKGRKLEEFDVYLDEIETLLNMKEKYINVNRDNRLYVLEIKRDLREICNLYFTEHMI